MSLKLFDLLWQLESWLREMVYIELRAQSASWESLIKKHVRDWPPKSQQNDKRYRHMPTRHQNAASYLATGELLEIIRDNQCWDMFKQYLPDKDLFESKIGEIKQIRHRVAHFRGPNDNDVERVRLFLKDIDKGVWNFCTSYNDCSDMLPRGVDDPVNEHFISTHDSRVVVEMRALSSPARPGSWLCARDSINPSVGFYLSYSVRPWTKLDSSCLSGSAGVVYHAKFKTLGRSDRSLDHSGLLEETQAVHENCIHIALHEYDGLAITVPSILGSEIVIGTIEQFLVAARGAYGLPQSTKWLAALAQRWPEYVLPPDHPLGFLSSDMPCSMWSQ